MRETWRFEPVDLFPSTDAILESQGIVGPRALSGRLAPLLAQASELYLRWAAPQALVEEISTDDFAAIYAGDGGDRPLGPVGDIFPRASRLALFVVTVGEPVSREISRRFDARDFAVGHLLDAIASGAAESAARRASDRYLQRVIACGARPAGLRALEYSPGYCGWDVRGQRPLFARLHPVELGVRLNDSCLMQPLKSVSGVIIAGPAEIHRFDETYPCCRLCRTRECRSRLAALGDGDAAQR